MLSEKIKELYAITNELESKYPGRKFTIDGHLVGSIGEVIVAEAYDLELLRNSTERHDAVSKNGINVQIKTTQINRISISAEPEHLIVIQILSDGSWCEIYNGPGKTAWDQAGKMQKNGQRQIYINKLKNLMDALNESGKIKRIL
mgnify:CR=1 FL=1